MEEVVKNTVKTQTTRQLSDSKICAKSERPSQDLHKMQAPPGESPVHKEHVAKELTEILSALQRHLGVSDFEPLSTLGPPAGLVRGSAARLLQAGTALQYCVPSHRIQVLGGTEGESNTMADAP